MQISQEFQNPPIPPNSGIVMGVGIDIASISRIASLVSRYDLETLSLLFTPHELNQCQQASNSTYHAVCFAAKEAVGKALGTGLVDISWNEIEANVTDVKLAIQVYGKASHQASQIGIQRWLATWCYWDDYVLVHVLGLH
jgi:holo-[acyl-carrier protein] synthase